MKEDPRQFGLFSTLTQRERQERKLRHGERRTQIEKLRKERADTKPVGPSIVRGFLSLHYPTLDNDHFMSMRLQCFNGYSMNETAVKAWPMVKAWIKEIRGGYEEFEWYIREYKDENV